MLFIGYGSYAKNEPGFEGEDFEKLREFFCKIIPIDQENARYYDSPMPIGFMESTPDGQIGMSAPGYVWFYGLTLHRMATRAKTFPAINPDTEKFMADWYSNLPSDIKDSLNPPEWVVIPFDC